MIDPEGRDVPGRRGEDLDPEVRRFVREVSEAWAGQPRLDTVTPEEARRIADRVRRPWTRGGPRMMTVTEFEVPVPEGKVRVRCYDPGPAGVKPGLVYLHGGGWTLFSLDTHDRLMREYAARTHIIVVGVSYSLAPAAKYPVAIDEVCGVVRFLRCQGVAIGLATERFAIGGDSAGANLATAVCLKLRDEGGPVPLCAMVLNYGVFERWSTPEAQQRFGGEGYMLSTEEMERFWTNYLRDDRDLESPLVCPINADLRGLPPALLVAGECDLLAEQSVRMADRFHAAGVPAELRVYRGGCHSFLEAVLISSLADRALRETAEWLGQILNGPGRGGRTAGTDHNHRSALRPDAARVPVRTRGGSR